MMNPDKLIIIYEDDGLLVVDKPSGMTTHPSRLHQGDTLADAVRAYLGVDESWTFRCINRLDKDTSGLTMIAKDLPTAQKLYKEMSEGKIQREYTALVEDDGSLDDTGTIDAPIARASDNPRDIRRKVDATGEAAITHYKVLARDDGTATVCFNLETGRTHQIRVHMAHIGHPIVNDPLYNPHSQYDTCTSHEANSHSDAQTTNDAYLLNKTHSPHGQMQLRATRIITSEREYKATRS